LTTQPGRCWCDGGAGVGAGADAADGKPKLLKRHGGHH